METVIKSKTEESKEKGNLLDNDKLRKLAGDEIDFDTLTQEEKTEFHSRFVEGDEKGVPTVEEEKEQSKNQTEQPSLTPNTEITPEKTVVEDKGENGSTVDTQELKKKLKFERDANNTLRQKLDSAKLKLDRINAMKVPEPPKIEDALDDNLTKQDIWNRQLANKLNTYANTEAEAIKRDKASAEKSLLYSDIAVLQAENPEIKTSLPIESIDKTYVRFRDGLLGVNATEESKNEAVNKFFTDAEFRKQKESEGLVFPIDESDWEKYKAVTQVVNYKKNGGMPNYDSSNGDKYDEFDVAYYKYKKENGIITDPVRKAVLDATTKVVDQVSQNQNKPNLLSPENGNASGGMSGMTEQQAEQWLIDHPTPSTPQDVTTLKAILNKYSPSSQSQGNQGFVF